MPELLRLKTDEFLFTVKATSIESRRITLTNTLSSRHSRVTDISVKTQPAIKLIERPRTFVDGLCSLPYAVADLHQCQQVNLDAPIFFENTLYQIEWIFLKGVQLAKLTHRAKSICDAFIFTPSEDGINARLTGTINTSNNVGWLRLPLTFELDGKTHTQHIAFEVLPTKMVLHQDLPAMYQAIDKDHPHWRFSLVEKTEQNVASNKKRGHFPLMWLANFEALRERFEQGLKVICSAPHSRLQPRVTHTKAAKLKGRLPHKLAAQVKQDFANGQHDKRYPVEKKHLSVDTAENRFIKMVVNHSKRQLADLEAKLRQSNQALDNPRLSEAFLERVHSWQPPLQKTLNQSFLKEVGAYTGLNKESLVLQQKTGYSAIYRVWQELKFYLDVFGNQSSISMKSVAEIYEIWCFLCIKQILENDLGFELTENSTAQLTENGFFEYQLKDGFAGAFKFTRADGVTARLAHEPKFTKKGKPIRSYLVNQEPDIVLEVTIPKSETSSDEQKFTWLFDAKYRIKTDKNRFEDNHEDIDTTDYVPDDAINQMHRYRDALIRLSTASQDANVRKSRPVFGAFALYPGFFDQNSTTNPYAQAIEEVGIGAFALLPSQNKPSQNKPSQSEPSQTIGDKQSDYCGHHWLLEFLQAQIGTAPNTQTAPHNRVTYPATDIAEKLYVQEAARIPHYGMRQVLYPDLTMTVALGGKRGRNKTYLKGFEQGSARWYHLPQSTFLQKFKHHIAEEIRYLALASTSGSQKSTKQIDKLWPVKHVALLPRYALTEEQTGKASNSAERYYLFELGKPLNLQSPVTNVPHRPIKNSMKLTKLSQLEYAPKFSDIKVVYADAIVRLKHEQTTNQHNKVTNDENR